MAETFKNARLVGTTAYTTIYTCPTATTAIVLMMQAANVDTSATYYVSSKWLDSSNANAATRLVNELGIPTKSSIGLIDGKLVLEAGDAVQVLAGADNKVEVTMSILEIT